MTAAAATKQTHAPLSNKAREMMEAINADAAKHHVWIRTQANAPAQRPWFSETGGEGSGQLASGRVAANQMKTLPYMWRWSEFSPYLHRISEIARKAEVSPIEFADRQSILLLNPGLNGRLQVTNTIRCAISIYNPGDVAPVHLHSPNASRTILSNKGGYTVVEGERCTAERGDLILTPNGTWHDHGNNSSEPVIWIDMLDWPLMEFLDAAWVDHDMPGAQGNAKVQAVTKSDGRSRRLYGHGGIKPGFVDHQIGVGRSPAPLIHYRGAEVLETLHGLRKEKGDAHEGIKISFVNPVTGEPVFKTLNYSAQLLRPGEETELGTPRPPARSTSSSKARARPRSAASASTGRRTTSLWCRISCGGATSIPARPTRYSIRSPTPRSCATSASTTRRVARRTARSPRW